MLLLCLLAFPASAWEQTWERHSQDLDESIFKFSSGVAKDVYMNGTSAYSSGTSQTITFNKTYDGYLAYTATHKSGSGWFKAGITLKDANGTIVFSNAEMVVLNTIVDVRRIEFIETSSGAGIDCYVNGAKSTSSAYIGSGEPTQIILNIHYENSAVWIDDISSDKAVIDLDNGCTYSDSGQYVKFAFPTMSSSYWFTRLYNPAGDLVDQFNITTGKEYLIPLSNLTQDGQYEIDIYRHYNTTNQNIYYTNKLFTNTLPSSATMSFIDQAYAPGDVVRITGHMSPFYPGYYITISGSTGDPDENARFDLTQEDQTFLYTIPATALDGSRVVCLRTPTGSPIQTGWFDIAGGTSGTSIRFDKNVYTNTNEIAIRYTDIPADATITVKGTYQGTEIFKTTYSKTGSGIFVHQLNGESINKVTAQVVQKGVILDADYAEVANGEYQVSGTVYDTEDKSTISGALIECAGRQITSGADGKFSLIVPAGTQTFQISANGYTTQTQEIDVINITQKQDFYLVAVPVGGEYANMLYGLVTDKDTGEPIQSAYIQIKNSTTGVTYSTLSWTDTGHYNFDYPDLAGSWVLTCQSGSYNTYKTTITISGQTYLQIKMSEKDYAADDSDWGDSDSSDSSGGSGGSGSSGSSTDRPSREAAKESLTWLEEIMPDLIKLVVVIFMATLIGVKL